MIGQTMPHYAPKAHPPSVAGALERKRPLADKIIEKLGETRLRFASLNFVGQGPSTEAQFLCWR